MKRRLQLQIRRFPTVAKTLSYYLVHILVAAAVAWAVTGNLWMALTLSLLEPTVQAFAFFAHERAWGSWLRGSDAPSVELQA
jgi:uncharacterized membrane protein